MNTPYQKPDAIPELGLAIRRSDPSRTGNLFDEILVGRHVRISFNRTLRIPEDGKTYPLPAGMGRLPIHRVEDYAGKVPKSWLEEGGYFIPLYQSEALFLGFNGPRWHPSIAKVCVGKINALSGDNYSERLSSHKQDYIVIPDQHWLDGVNSGNGVVRQFVAMPLGKGYTIEAQISDEEIHGGFQLLIFDAVAGRFPERDPAIDNLIKKIRKARLLSLYDSHFLTYDEEELYFSLFGKDVQGDPNGPEILYQSGYDPPMGISAGGNIEQMIIADPYGVNSWDQSRKKSVTIHLVNSLSYKHITGTNPPDPPITKEEYEYRGIPWFSFYDENAQKVTGPSSFKRILGVSQIEARRGESNGDSKEGIDIPVGVIRKIRTPDAAEAAEAFRSRAYESAAKSEWSNALFEISGAIDLEKQKRARDYALRCFCNYNLGNFHDGEVDGSLGLEIDQDCNDARSWRACCRLAVGDHEGVKEDADVLVNKPETAIFGYEMRAEAAMLIGCYQDAINDALSIRELDANNSRAEQVIAEALSKGFQQ